MPETLSSYLNCFVDGTVLTLKALADLEVNPIEIYKKGEKHQSELAIAGTVGFVCEYFTGALSICFPKAVFLSLHPQIFGSDPLPEITPEMEDSAGELLNMICGQTKMLLIKKGFTFEVTIPTILRGEAIQTCQTAGREVFVLPFNLGDGECYLEANLQPK